MVDVMCSVQGERCDRTAEISHLERSMAWQTPNVPIAIKGLYRADQPFTGHVSCDAEYH